MMRPEFKHKQKNKIPPANRTTTQQSQKPSAYSSAPVPIPIQIPSAHLRKKKSAVSPHPVLKTGSNRLPLAPSSKELVPFQASEGKSNRAVIAASPTTLKLPCRDLVPYQGKNRLTDGLILPDAQISVDKLLSQWADKIEKAEQEFVLEEIAFERARERIKSKNGRKLLQALPHPRTSTSALIESAGRMLRHAQDPRTASALIESVGRIVTQSQDPHRASATASASALIESAGKMGRHSQELRSWGKTRTK